MTRSSLREEIATVTRICRELGMGDVTPTLLKAAHHTTFLISPRMIVARVQSADPIAMAMPRATLEIAVARHLAKRGAPALVPLEGVGGPHVAGSSVITFWPYVAHALTAADVPEDDATASAIGSLASIHRALLDYDGELPPYTEALDRCWAILADSDSPCVLAEADRHLLKAQYRRLRDEVDAMRGEWVPLHGDAHLGNLLLGGHGPVWVDFEDACLGPREYDIASLPPDTWSGFAEIDLTAVRAYADLKNVCVAVWCSADMSRSADIREAANYHLQRVRQFTR